MDFKTVDGLRKICKDNWPEQTLENGRKIFPWRNHLSNMAGLETEYEREEYLHRKLIKSKLQGYIIK